MYLLDLNTKRIKNLVYYVNPDPEHILVYTLSFIFFLFSFFFIIEL